MKVRTASWSGGVPGYSDALPDGAFALGIPDVHIETDKGIVKLPPGNGAAGYLNLAKDGVQIICQGQSDDRAWLWDGQHWHQKAPVFGPNAVIFNAQDRFVLNDTIEKYQTTGGLRFVDASGHIVTCAATYADPVRGLYEFTDFGDVAIGQGGNEIGEGAVVRFADDGILRRLSWETSPGVFQPARTGPLRSMRIRRDGDKFAITVLDYAARVITIVTCSLAELRALSPVTKVGTKVPDPGTPPVEPIPVTLPDPPKRRDIVDEQWAFHPSDGSPDANLAFCRRVARALRDLDPRWGLNWKRGKEGSPSRDVIAFRWGPFDTDARIVDILVNSDDPQAIGPAWTLQSVEAAGPVRWYWDEVPDDPKPRPEPQPVSVDAVIRALIAAEVAGLHDKIADLTDRVRHLEEHPAAEPISIDGARIALRTDNGHVLCAEGGGGGAVHSDRVEVGGWETFTVEVQ